MTTQTETEATPAQLATRCDLIQIVSTEPYVYALDVSFGSDTPAWQPTSTPIARFLMDTYTLAASPGASTKEFIKEMHSQYQYSQTQKEQLETQRRVIMLAHEGFATISRRFAEEADSRGWCDDANDFVKGVNEDLSAPFSLEELYHDYEVTAVIAPALTACLTTVIRARSQDIAEDLMRDDLSSYFDEGDIWDALRDGVIDSYDIQSVDSSEVF